jgi:NADPH-dependent glutamate synthase beta subunit-like oxidoreductase
MKVRITKILKDPYLGYNALEVARTASACLQCTTPTPYTLACSRQADIPRVARQPMKACS